MRALKVLALAKLTVALLMVVVPVAAPRAMVVAAPPRFKVVAPELKTDAVPVEVVVMSEPFKAKSPEVVMSPVPPVIEKLVAVTFPEPRAKALVMLESERSIAVVTAPPLTPATLIPTGRLRSVSRFLTKTNSLGSAVPEPSALWNLVSEVEPVAVVTVKLESVAVSSKVKARSRLLAVVIVLPPL